MIDATMKIGDRVIITIEEDSRKWGYNPCPDGTEATILEFSEIHRRRIHNFGLKPGVYVNRCWVRLLLENGGEYTESSSRLDLVDEAEYEKRLAEFRALQKNDPDFWRVDEFLRDLPETPLWEGDYVKVLGEPVGDLFVNNEWSQHGPDIFQITRINYHDLNEVTQMGTPYPAYNISNGLNTGWYTSRSENDLMLVERGPIWKFYHNEPITFGGLEEEARFFDLLGHTTEVRNPETGMYSWTKDQVLDAIQNGLVHGFSISSGFFGSGPRISASRFRNEDLGQRVGQATLEGFGLSKAS